MVVICENFGCTKPDGKYFQILQGKQGCENQSVSKKTKTVTLCFCYDMNYQELSINFQKCILTIYNS